MLSFVLITCLLVSSIGCDSVLDEDFKKLVLSEIGALTAKVDALENKLQLKEEENMDLKKQLDRHARQGPLVEETFFPETEVAFYALVSSHIKNLTAHQTIVFGNVKTNIGNSYNGATGIFHAPTDGTYLLFANILSESNNSIETEMIVNGNSLAEIYSGAGHFHGAGSNLAITRLNKGDNVWVKVHAAFSTDMSVHCCWSSFSGYLLREVAAAPVIG